MPLLLLLLLPPLLSWAEKKLFRLTFYEPIEKDTTHIFNSATNQSKCDWLQLNRSDVCDPLPHPSRHQSFFTDTSIEALGLDTAHHIEIWSDKRVTLSKSSHHFDDINILGTDFLQHCDLHAFYTRRAVELVVSPTPTLTAVWVQQRDAPGKPVGPAFEVSPAMSDVDALKDAIKAGSAMALLLSERLHPSASS
jgi:hypothetical protein